MSELGKASRKAYSNVPVVLTIRLMQNERKVVEQDFLDSLVEKLRFENIALAACKVDGQFPREELSLNEDNSYTYLLIHEDFNVSEGSSSEGERSAGTPIVL